MQGLYFNSTIMPCLVFFIHKNLYHILTYLSHFFNNTCIAGLKHTCTHTLRHKDELIIQVKQSTSYNKVNHNLVKCLMVTSSSDLTTILGCV